MPLGQRPFWSALAIAALPSAAQASDLAFPDVFAAAAPPQKLIIVALFVATGAATVISAVKLASRSLAGGSGFVSGLRWGGPIAGVLGAAYATLRMSVGLARVTPPVTLKVLAPAFAEIATMIALGFSVGIVAVAFTWAMEARLDREVLKTSP